MLDVHPSRTGDPTGTWAGRQLHSQFDPVREAARFAASQIDSVPAIAIVIGPGLGYIPKVIESRYPGSRVISIYVSEILFRKSEYLTQFSWHPGVGESLQTFLDRAVGEMDATAACILEWTPVTECFPDVSRSVRQTVSATLRQRHSSLLTEGAFGRRWIRNMAVNFLSCEDSYRFKPSSESGVAALVIAAAGPSLEEALPLVAPLRDRITLWVTASALDSVVAAGLTPDMVIATDAAFYAAEHLREIISGSLPEVPVCAPLSATRGLHDVKRLVLFEQHDFVESLLLREANVTVVTVPPNGSVSGSALELAELMVRSPVVFAGLDAAWKDVASHARPHLADVYRERSANRFAPSLTASWMKAADSRPLRDGWQTDRTLLTYMHWFRTKVERGASLYRLCPSPVDIGIPPISPAEIAAMETKHPYLELEPLPWPRHAKRKEAVRSMFDRAVRCIRQVTTAAARSPVLPSNDDAVGLTLLRRLQLPTMIEWYRGNGGESEFRRLRESAIGDIQSIARDLA